MYKEDKTTKASPTKKTKAKKNKTPALFKEIKSPKSTTLLLSKIRIKTNVLFHFQIKFIKKIISSMLAIKIILNPKLLQSFILKTKRLMGSTFFQINPN